MRLSVRFANWKGYRLMQTKRYSECYWSREPLLGRPGLILELWEEGRAVGNKIADTCAQSFP